MLPDGIFNDDDDDGMFFQRKSGLQFSRFTVALHIYSLKQRWKFTWIASVRLLFRIQLIVKKYTNAVD
jgi:hypothetical protein